MKIFGRQTDRPTDRRAKPPLKATSRRLKTLNDGDFVKEELIDKDTTDSDIYIGQDKLNVTDNNSNECESDCSNKGAKHLGFRWGFQLSIFTFLSFRS